MKPAPYCPETLKRIKTGATAHDLGWDDAMYASVCRRHQITPAVQAKPSIVADKPKASLEAKHYRAAVIPVRKRDGGAKPKPVCVSVTIGMHAGAHATADEDNSSASEVLRKAMEWACEPRVILADWRKGVHPAVSRTVTALIDADEHKRFTAAASDRDLKLPEFARRALAGWLKHQDFGA